jgi:hypothetical protein
MNTTPLSFLLSHVTPNEVWFGKKAWGPFLKIPDSDTEEEDSEVESTDKEEDLNSEDKSFLLSGLSELN